MPDLGLQNGMLFTTKVATLIPSKINSTVCKNWTKTNFKDNTIFMSLLQNERLSFEKHHCFTEFMFFFLRLTAFLFEDFYNQYNRGHSDHFFYITEIFQISTQQQDLSHSSIIEGLLSWRRGQNWILTILRCRAPKTYTGIITHRHKNLRIDWVPCHTVYSSGVTTKNSNRVVSFDMEDVNLVVLRSRRHE